MLSATRNDLDSIGQAMSASMVSQSLSLGKLVNSKPVRRLWRPASGVPASPPKPQIRSEAQPIQRQRSLQLRDQQIAHTKLQPFGAHQWRYLVNRVAGLRVGDDDGASRIVAAKATAQADVQPGGVERAEDQVQLQAQDAVVGRARVGAHVTAHLEPEGIGPQSDRGAERLRPRATGSRSGTRRRGCFRRCDRAASWTGSAAPWCSTNRC